MSNYRMDTEEEALFKSYQYPLYFVQSPSTVSHANSPDLRGNNNIIHESSTFQSPNRSGPINNNPNPTQEAARIALSRYSSSRGSNHSSSIWHEKKISYDGALIEINGGHCPKGVKDEITGGYDDNDDEEEEYYGREKGWQKYFSFGYSNSFCWIFLQLTWRIVVSLAAAMLVFYIATKPPEPKVSIKIARISKFALAEGVDATGVTTKFLSCNCSIDLVIDNKSKLFGLNLHPPIMSISFGKLPFTVSQGSEMYANPHDSTSFKLYTGTRNKAMYGAGMSMQDLLESGNGLPLMVRVELSSRFHVLSGLINPKYHHTADCLLFIRNRYDKKHRTQAYNSTCMITS